MPTQSMHKTKSTFAILVKAVSVMVGAVCGVFAGVALGVLSAIALGYLTQLANPDDPSAGSVAIVVIFTVPAGAMLGGALGGVLVVARPWLFRLTILPLAILFLGYLVAMRFVHETERPRDFVVQVCGTPEAAYVGVVSLNGETQELNGTLPETFEYSTSKLEFAFALEHPNEEDSIVVNVHANGKDLETGFESETGIHLQLRSYGYFEPFGGVSSVWSRMSEEEIGRLIRDQRMPEKL